MAIEYQIDCPQSSECPKVLKIKNQKFKKEYKRVEKLIKVCGECFLKRHEQRRL